MKDSYMLWTAFKKNPSTDLKKKLILQYQNLVHYVIHHSKFSTLGILDERDYFSYGVEGLSEAIDRFDPEYGTKFETYAIQRIRGKIIDELRKTQMRPKINLGQGQEMTFTSISLDNPENEDSGMLYESLPVDAELPDEASLRSEAKEILADALKNLDERERLIITLIYYENLNYKDIAQLLSITIPRVSQIHSKIIDKLKKKVINNYN